MYWAPVAAARRGFKMVLFTASRGNTFVGGKCALPSALLVLIHFIDVFEVMSLMIFENEEKHFNNWIIRFYIVCCVL